MPFYVLVIMSITRGGSIKYRTLRLDTGKFTWISEGCARKTSITVGVYNVSNNKLVRAKTLVKDAIVIETTSSR